MKQCQTLLLFSVLVFSTLNICMEQDNDDVSIPLNASTDMFVSLSREINHTRKKLAAVSGWCQCGMGEKRAAYTDTLENLRDRRLTLAQSVKSIHDIRLQDDSKKLDLQYKQLKTICDISHTLFTYLKKMDISHNALTTLPLDILVQECPRLKTLDASHNAIESLTYVHKKIKNGSLRTCYLNDNSLSYIDLDALHDMYPVITTLYLSDNPIKHIDLNGTGSWHAPYRGPDIYAKNTLLKDSEKIDLALACVEKSRWNNELHGRCWSGLGAYWFTVGVLGISLLSIGLATDHVVDASVCSTLFLPLSAIAVNNVIPFSCGLPKTQIHFD